MGVCIYVCMYACMYIYIYIYIYTDLSIYLHLDLVVVRAVER